MSSTSIPNFVWWPIAVLIGSLVLPIFSLVCIVDYKAYQTKYLELKIGELELIIADVLKSTHKLESEYEFITMPTLAEPCSYTSSQKMPHPPKTSCNAYYVKKSEQITSLLKNEKQTLEKANKQLQELRTQLQTNR